MSKFLHYGASAQFDFVNPNFYPNENKLIAEEATDPYTINCVNCAIATELNIRCIQGIDVDVRPFCSYVSVVETEQGNRFSALPSKYQTISELAYVYNSDFLDIFSTKPMKEIRRRTTDAGENSGGIIFVQREDGGNDNPGHVFNVWRKGGKTVEFIDGQRNRIVTGFERSMKVIALLIIP
jgi:Papain fold toxin 1, glutamine deamidase